MNFALGRAQRQILLSVALAIIGTSPAKSQSGSPEAICTGRLSAKVQERTEACTSLIVGGTFSGDRLAILYTSRGSAWRAEGDVDRALADQNDAIRLKPDSAILYFNRAVTWQSKGDANRAIADYGEAIRLAPTFALGYKNRGDSYYSIADFDRAIADYDSAIRLNSDYAEALARRGLAKLQKGDAEGRNADIQAAYYIDHGVVARLLGPQGIAPSLGQGFLVRKKLKIFSALELDGATICVQTDAGLDEKLKAYFDAHAMKFTLNTYRTFDEALHAYNDGRCDVLAANISTLRASRSAYVQPGSHALLPEVFAR